MSDDRYAGAAHGWAHGATIVYGPIARQLVATAPHSLAGRTVLDLGAGTGVASVVLGELGALPVALDLSLDMLSWQATRRPPAAVADAYHLPLRDAAIDDTVAGFVFNHLTDPVAGMAETVRATRSGGPILAGPSWSPIVRSWCSCRHTCRHAEPSATRDPIASDQARRERRSC